MLSSRRIGTTQFTDTVQLPSDCVTRVTDEADIQHYRLLLLEHAVIPLLPIIDRMSEGISQSHASLYKIKNKNASLRPITICASKSKSYWHC
jgi:hypothetical protein